MTDAGELLALADEYEAGLKKMEASGYEEFDGARKSHRIVIDALRAQARPTPVAQCEAEPVTLEQLHFNEIKRSQALEAECDRLRSLLAAPARCDAESAKVERDRIIELCATVAEGFDAACNSSRMKLFVEAGLVTAIYKRDGDIGAAIRELKDSPLPSTHLCTPPEGK